MALLCAETEALPRPAGSKIPDGRVIVPPQVLAHVEQECQRQVDNNGRPEREKRGIDEKKPDAAGRNAHYLSEPGAHPERMVLKE